MDLGVSEAARKVSNTLGNSALGSMAKKFANALERKSAGGLNIPVTLTSAISGDGLRRIAGIKTASASMIPTAENAATRGLDPVSKSPAPTITKPTDTASRSSSLASNRDAEVRRLIGAGWDDAKDAEKVAEDSLSATGKAIGQLGKVRDQYLKANDAYKGKVDTAVAGNKELIEKNQKEELDDLAADTRRTADNTTVMLGVKGATGGSAQRAAGKAIARMAGKERAKVLTARGDEFSQQTQEAQKAAEEYELRRKQAYDWEDDARKQAVNEYQAALKALKNAKAKKGDWKAKDIEAESDKYLNRFLTTIAEISAAGKTFRDQLYTKYSEFGGAADELESAAIDVSAPAELMTPDFSPEIDLNDPNNAEDFYDPNKVGKRVIKGYDALGNPIYEDELALASAA